VGPEAQTGQVVCHPGLLLIAKRCKNILRLCVWASLVASSVELGRSVARSMAQTNTTQQKAVSREEAMSEKETNFRTEQRNFLKKGE